MANEYQSTKAYSTTDFSETKLCKNHELPLQFVCTQVKCQKIAILCAQCLPDHRDHSWQTLNNIYKQINSLHKTEFINSDRAEVVEKQIKVLMSKFKKKIDRKAIELQSKISRKIESIKEKFQLLSQKSKQVNQQNVLNFLKILKKDQRKSSDCIQAIQKFVDQSIKAAQLKIITILNDIQLSIDVDWVKCTPQQRKISLQSLKNQINEPIQEIINKPSQLSLQRQLKFDKSLKHPGIDLNDNGTEVTYSSNASKGPVVILNSKVTNQAKYTFEIVKLAHTAFFFPDTTIFIGVCLPQVVKNAGLRRINQSGKGAYLIGSTGWSYHHKLPQYDRKNIVGWRFTEKDRITIEINFSQSGQIKFIKQGFFFDSEFLMPLDLSQAQLKLLQPCLSFEADFGAVVRLINASIE